MSAPPQRSLNPHDSNVASGRLKVSDLRGRVAIVTGGSRGIGRECCLALARAGAKVVIAAKTTEPHPTLPGTIHTVAAEVRAIKNIFDGKKSEALAYKLDLRDADKIKACVQAVISKWDRVDILINNASALWWQNIVDTPANKYDLITSINARGTFLMTRACLPHMAKNNFGRVITMSPPIRLDGMGGHTAYNISMFGMTMVALGVSAEYQKKNVTGNSVWPATVVESLASINFKLGARKLWRKASILSDAAMMIISQGSDFRANMLIDDTFLLTQGLTSEDLKVYRYDPNFEPPRLLDMSMDAITNNSMRQKWKRGDIKVVNQEMQNDIDPSLQSKL